ncbi:MAG: DUF5995 family protein [Saprospiraceae bacterium]|nr:DUF5995 family protein [Saprospiraceae bacterium]
MHDLLDRMNAQASAWERKGDQRCHFQRCYSMMSANMVKAIADGRFHDAAWVERLMLRFADYYYDALQLYDGQSDQTPAVWKQVHDATCHRRLHILQRLLLGINAHINYDLPLALYECLRDEWPTADETARQRRREDHETVNRVIAETIDAVQDSIIEPRAVAMALIDRLMGRTDEWLLAQLIRNWRTEVWLVARQLLEANDDHQRENICRIQESRVLKRGRRLMLEELI